MIKKNVECHLLTSFLTFHSHINKYMVILYNEIKCSNICTQFKTRNI